MFKKVVGCQQRDLGVHNGGSNQTLNIADDGGQVNPRSGFDRGAASKLEKFGVGGDVGLQVLAVEELLVGFQPLGSATRPLACSIEDHQTRKGFLGDESVKHDVNCIVGHEGVVGDGFVGAVVDGVVVVVVGDINGEKHLFRLGVLVAMAF